MAFLSSRTPESTQPGNLTDSPIGAFPIHEGEAKCAHARPCVHGFACAQELGNFGRQQGWLPYEPSRNLLKNGMAGTTGLSSTVSPVTAKIGGVDATVTFAGLAPTFVALYQLNPDPRQCADRSRHAEHHGERRIVESHDDRSEVGSRSPISACTARKSDWQVKLDPIMRHFRDQPSARIAFQPHQAVARHGLQGT